MSIIDAPTLTSGSVLAWRTETPTRNSLTVRDPEPVYVHCNTCGYEKEFGQRCGEPCV